MLKAIWFLIKLAALVAAALWIAARPGTVEIEWLSYQVHMGVGTFFAILFVGICVLMLLHRGVLAIKRAPKSIALYQERSGQHQAQRAVVQGLSAIAAGDLARAESFTRKARKHQHHDYGMADLLEGMTSRMRGDTPSARRAFERLLDHKDTAFLGVRGLLQVAMDEGQLEKAITMAGRAHTMHPKQRWIVKTLYQLYLQAQDWDNADRILTKARKLGVVSAAQANSDRVAIDLAKGMEAMSRGDADLAHRLSEKAFKRDKTSLPAALALLTHEIRAGRRRQAVALVEKAWKYNPHPDLLTAWKALAPQNKKKALVKTMAWYERLLAIKPDSDEGQMAVAEMALSEGMYGEARAYLKMAERIRPSKKLYRLLAKLEDSLGQEDAARKWLERAVDAPDNKVWTCAQSGLAYDRWMPFAPPHNSFNTILWDYPGVGTASGASLATAQGLLGGHAKGGRYEGFSSLMIDGERAAE